MSHALGIMLIAKKIMLKFVLVAIVFIVLMVANHRVAKEKGRKSVLIWTAFGIFFPIFAIFLNLVLPEKSN